MQQTDGEKRQSENEIEQHRAPPRVSVYILRDSHRTESVIC